MAKFLALVSGMVSEVVALVTSSGAADAGKMVATDSTGRLDSSVLPVGIGAETDTITASEALSAGDFVNLWNSSGVKARKADGSTSGKTAHGFVLAAVASGASATVYRVSQINTQLTGMTPGATQYLSNVTPGGHMEAYPTASGQTNQILGVAKSATELIFAPSDPITVG